MADDRPTRGRSSKVDLLPENIKQQLHQMLREKAITQQEILESINAMIDVDGLPDDLKLSRSGLNRYASQVEKVGASLRQMREMTAALTAQLGDKPTGEVTKLILEMGRGQLFKLFMAQANDPEAEVDVGMLKEAMLAAQRLEATAMSSHKREKEIRTAFAEEAAAKAEEIVTQAGLTKDTAAQIRREILGIA